MKVKERYLVVASETHFSDTDGISFIQQHDHTEKEFDNIEEAEEYGDTFKSGMFVAIFKTKTYTLEQTKGN